MSGRSDQSLFFITVPDLQKLCCVFLSFQSSSDEGELRNKQVKTCRELLFLHPDVVASPVLGCYGGISVIMAISLFKRGIVQTYAQSHDLQVGCPQRVLPATLQSCLSYSLTARLAPNWNRAGQYLIAGKDFLSEAGKLSAVVMKLSMNETQLCVSVEVSTGRLPPALLEDFDIPSPVLKNFKNNREAVLHTTLPNNWCYILPSMKRGQIISVSHKVPQECPFQSYAELQDHWSRMYGYCLPPLNEDEEVYCSVYFKPLGEKLFTYPLSCIRAQPVQCFPRVDLQRALGDFTSDLRSLLENICGFTAQMSSKPCYPTTDLSRPVSQDSGALPANLTSTFTGRPVLTQLPFNCTPGKAPLCGLASSHWPLSQPGGLSSKMATFSEQKKAEPTFLQSSHCYSSEPRWFPSSSMSLPPYSSTSSSSSSSSSSSTLSLHSQARPASQASKLVPIFKNKSLTHHINVTKILAEKRQQGVDVENQRAPGGGVKRALPSSSFSPSSSTVSVPLPQRLGRPLLHNLSFCKGRDEDQSGSQTPSTIPNVPKNRGEDVFESRPKKPKVSMQDVDVVAYAKSNQLRKVNVTTLQAWLRGRGVAVCSKDKKKELVSKVMRCLCEP